MQVKDKLGNLLSVGDTVVDGDFRVGKIVSFTKDSSQNFYWVNLNGGKDLTFRPYAPSFDVALLTAIEEAANILS